MAKLSSMFAFLGGAALGAAAIYLYCTEKGARVLESIQDAGGKIFDEGKEKISDAIDSVERTIRKARNEFEDECRPEEPVDEQPADEQNA